ncbi:pilus assembly protein TadG-related protein [Streptomyces sp. XD-27]|uniref:pilus assembly protein TadG-related protein n=1 Tax=Streptomyces sp. XD-27 TaxID=3062779 RepID=UPI0026F4750F|nr:pilus assembly protein TadG-related protein [Streptomyces sp. XD-27]WKX72300.1 pilus assembly protein TadG-related protein [Streptomyces sp. XD-27]
MKAHHRHGDAGQAFPIYITAVAGLLFLALVFFAVGQAGAARNGGQTAADAAALAAAQNYRDQLRTSLQKAIGSGGRDWSDILAGRGVRADGACDDARWFAGRNDADVTACRPGYLPASFTVTVRTRHTVGKSVVPGTERRHATAKAKAVVEPRCAPSGPVTLPTPEESEDGKAPSKKDKGKGDGGNGKGEDGGARARTRTRRSRRSASGATAAT